MSDTQGILMARKIPHAAWLAGVSGAVFPSLPVAVWTTLNMMWRPPMSRMPRVLGQPLIFGFVAAAIAGSWFAPRISARQKPCPESRG